MMNRLSPRIRITVGLLGLLVSALLLAIVLRIVPDRREAVLEGRSRLCEAMAVNTSVLISRADMKRLQAILTVLVKRHGDIQSAGVRTEGGELLLEVGEHTDQWQELIGEYSTDAQVMVPLVNDGAKLALEVRFEPLHGSLLHEVLHNQWVRLVAFVAVACAVSWYMYLGKVLDQLNPSHAVPGRVRSALDTLAEGLLVLDSKGRIVLCNVALADTLGHHCDDLTGVPASSLDWVRPESEAQPHPWTQVLQAAADGPIHASSVLESPDHSGSLRIFKANCSPVMGANNEIRGVVCSFEDITELESQKVALAQSKAAAESANLAKSQFLANMSHEIRTPLNAILGFADVLRRGMFENEQQRSEYLNTIHSSGNHLLHLINDILDLSKVEAGHLEVEHVACSPHQLILDVITVLKVKADEKDLSLSASTPGGLPETVTTDPVRLRQILTNIIGNALKFTRDGGVSLVARTLMGSEARIQIDITDTGVGISEEAQKRIFDPFSQADGSITRKFGGTGLGLTISRKFAEAMGGSLTVRSIEGQGSTFSIVFAIGDIAPDAAMLDISQFSQMTQAAAESAGQMSYNFGAARILVVDDGEANRQLIELVLRRDGLSVDSACNGQEAVELATEFEYDLILMDMQMPVLDGYQATGQLREQGLEIPIVALTANAMRGDEEKCLNAGCTAFVSKPVDLDELLECMAELLDAEQCVVVPAAIEVVSESSVLEHATVAEPEKPHAAIAADPELSPRPLDVANTSARHEETGSANDEDSAEFAPLGKDKFSMSRDELLDMLWTETDAAQSDADPRVPSDPTVNGFVSEPADDGAIRSSLPLEDDEFRQIVCGFAEKLRTEVQAMERALDAGDIKEIGRLAHWLKGAAGTMGFAAFTEPGTRLMEHARDGHMDRLRPALEKIVDMTLRVEVPELDGVEALS